MGRINRMTKMNEDVFLKLSEKVIWDTTKKTGPLAIYYPMVRNSAYDGWGTSIDGLTIHEILNKNPLCFYLNRTNSLSKLFVFYSILLSNNFKSASKCIKAVQLLMDNKVDKRSKRDVNILLKKMGDELDDVFKYYPIKEESNMGNTIKAFENAKPATKGKNGSYFLKLHLCDSKGKERIVLINPLIIAYIREDVQDHRTIITLSDRNMTQISVTEEILDVNMMLELEMRRFRMDTEE